ncbi:UDP-N-acetylmuramate dehydrogenase [Maribacter sp. HTCC2170]|uniref:UDP-N-acetylmuramate dehydrogenase n=1 Tax=Maribacter sp. (strain HTCC2170 / KCCM 42371) TaxID=313603 RepID=UPI00006B1AE0|nr:UDP-N-acetylmuramate dehydrogenase [Maribacter sp. HTCC2170]EAR00699.1 UDP-N-acetylenolpyruvoylglucosamine reductase [Maribacter sp. HTCC2170]
MKIQKNISLKDHNTFGIEALAKYFCEIKSVNALKNALQFDDYPNKFILSGGSNLLITKDIDALVLHINIKGKDILEEDNEYVLLKVMAGEIWHDMILWCLDQGYGGLENMSLIPGNTGTAPIQNIGAYGVELKDNFVSCEAMNIEDQSIQTFTKDDCNFGYRDSFFKNEGKGQYIITSVTFRLTKENHNLNTSYGAIEGELKKQGIVKPSIKDISNAVVTIRQSKLPDPKKLGNSGSFFKNPVLTKLEFNTFITAHPEARYYKVTDDQYKVPAGWLIEQCGFKGKRYGDAGVHKNQALVLVNHGKATGKEILDLAKRIIDKVFEVYKITITPEVNIIK